MGFGQWFWRLFLVFSGLIVAQVLVVILLTARHAASLAPAISPVELWATAGVTIAAGGVAVWYCVRTIVQPLSELSRQVQSASGLASTQTAPLGPWDEVGALSGAFDQMQRDLAQRLAQFRDNHQRLETVLSSMAEGVLAVGADDTILLANEAARRLLDFAAPHPQGRSLLEVTRARPVYDALVRALASEAPVVKEFEAPGAIRRTLSLRATRLPGAPCAGVVMVLHDMTELRRLESLRRELVANVSHELKTPLAAIKGYAETLRLGAVNDPEHNLHFIRRIEEQTDRLHQLILDMLQIARVESGEQPLELADVPIAELIGECTDQFMEGATAKQVELSADLPHDKVAVYADEEGVRTILSNLLDNALKYTPAGGRVTAGARAHAGLVVLEVADTGIGIPEKDLARIFERFYCVDKARSRQLGGTGLGLSIVKHLAQAMGGSVSVESRLGRGSTFRVELPRGQVSVEPRTRAALTHAPS
jgi:two-component system, OmpR family, phosphate regulon sensor histidine kinase PhoR